MSSFHKSLFAHLSQLGLPVYLDGQIPGSAPFPYICCTLGSASFGGIVPITATAWFLGRNGSIQRAALCDRMQELIPDSGVQLSFDGGSAVVYRGSSEFISLITDATEPRSLGARIRLTVKLYDL